MFLISQLRALKKQTEKEMPAEALSVLKKAIEELSASDAVGGVFGSGDKAPRFSLKNVHGEIVSSADTLKNGKLVVNFYRGTWCSYCNLELRALQESYRDFVASGAELLAISPQLPRFNMDALQRHALEFNLLTDPGNRVASRFGLVYRLEEEVRQLFLKSGIDLSVYNGDDSWTLPMPATFIIDEQSVIRYAAVNPDHTMRPEPGDALATLRRLP